MLARQNVQRARLLFGMQSRNFGAVQKAAPDQKMLTAAASDKTMVFDGLKGSKPATFELDNIYRHQNDLPLSK